MITVHHLEHSRSHRVLWLLEELGLPYELRRYARDPKTYLAPPELRRVHPLGKSPVVEVDGEMTLAESGAILEVLDQRHGGRLQPAAGTPDWRRCCYWMHYAEGSLMPLLLLKLVFDNVERKSPWLVRPVAKGIAGKLKALLVTPQLPRHLDWMETALSQAPWFSGAAFGLADIQMSFPVAAAAGQRGGGLGQRPRLAAYLAAIAARPAYQRAEAAGGPPMP